jgi:putative heme iron utilization protein
MQTAEPRKAALSKRLLFRMNADNFDAVDTEARATIPNPDPFTELGIDASAISRLPLTLHLG